MSQKTKTDSKSIQKSTRGIQMDKSYGKSDGNSKHGGMKPDKNVHESKNDMGTMAKKASLPGQQYVPKKCHNESDFAGEER